MQDFAITSTLRDGVWVIDVTGEARVEFSDDLVREVARLLEQTPTDVLLNCKQLQFMDSASTGALLRVDAQTRSHDRRMALFHLSPIVQRVLDVTNLAECFAIAPDETQARALLTER